MCELRLASREAASWGASQPEHVVVAIARPPATHGTDGGSPAARARARS
eukprot:COSAG02_NODE_5323_length_4438_cov_6.014519_4_plen_48_part_01